MKKEFKIKTRNIHDGSEAVIRGDFIVPSTERKLPLLVLMHGFKGFKDWGFFPYICETLNSIGIATLKFNFSHNGVGEDLVNFTELDKFKKNTFSQEVSDLQCVFDFITQNRNNEFSSVDFDQISLFGHSRGAFSVIVGGLDLPIYKAISFAGISSFPSIPKDVEHKWRNDGERLVENKRTNQMMPLGVYLLDELLEKKGYLESCARKFSSPLLILHGAKDITVPVDSAKLMNKLVVGSRIEVIETGDHVFNIKHPFNKSTSELDKTLDLIIDFLNV